MKEVGSLWSVAWESGCPAHPSAKFILSHEDASCGRELTSLLREGHCYMRVYRGPRQRSTAWFQNPKDHSFFSPAAGVWGAGSGGGQLAWPAQQPQGKNLQPGLSFLTSCPFLQCSQNVKPGTRPPGFCNLRIKQTGSLAWGGLGMREHVQKFSKIRL